MAENLAQEIRDQEALAKSIVANAKAEAAKMLAAAQTEAEQSVKSTKQQCHRQWRERVAAADQEAEARAGEITAKGEADAKLFYEKKKNETKEVADWLVREVMAAYGSR
ncbi:MAG: cell envelope biogenesis protein TolA [Synergistaceae bacterium]|nr:cell envelope biogenesis protein TolA [Synergistaceae bacterium]